MVVGGPASAVAVRLVEEYAVAVAVMETLPTFVGKV
jgi:hypothetical protein